MDMSTIGRSLDDFLKRCPQCKSKFENLCKAEFRVLTKEDQEKIVHERTRYEDKIKELELEKKAATESKKEDQEKIEHERTRYEDKIKELELEKKAAKELKKGCFSCSECNFLVAEYRSRICVDCGLSSGFLTKEDQNLRLNADTQQIEKENILCVGCAIEGVHAGHQTVNYQQLKLEPISIEKKKAKDSELAEKRDTVVNSQTMITVARLLQTARVELSKLSEETVNTVTWDEFNSTWNSADIELARAHSITENFLNVADDTEKSLEKVVAGLGAIRTGCKVFVKNSGKGDISDGANRDDIKTDCSASVITDDMDMSTIGRPLEDFLKRCPQCNGELENLAEFRVLTKEDQEKIVHERTRYEDKIKELELEKKAATESKKEDQEKIEHERTRYEDKIKELELEKKAAKELKKGCFSCSECNFLVAEYRSRICVDCGLSSGILTKNDQKLRLNADTQQIEKENLMCVGCAIEGVHAGHQTVNYQQLKLEPISIEKKKAKDSELAENRDTVVNSQTMITVARLLQTARVELSKLSEETVNTVTWDEFNSTWNSADIELARAHSITENFLNVADDTEKSLEKVVAGLGAIRTGCKVFVKNSGKGDISDGANRDDIKTDCSASVITDASEWEALSDSSGKSDQKGEI